MSLAKMNYLKTQHRNLAHLSLQVRISTVEPLILVIILAACFLGHRQIVLKSSRLGTLSEAKDRVEFARPSERIVADNNGRSNPTSKLSNGQELSISYVGENDLRLALEQNRAKPLSLEAGDFDEDGMPDLVSGYAYKGDGILTLLPGNTDCIYPHTSAAQQRRAQGEFSEAPFLSSAQVFRTPVAADFMGVGDFDADSHWDVVIGAQSGSKLYLLSGNGKGALTWSREIALPGTLTAFTTGEINRRDGLTDLVVGVNGADGPKALVFEGPEGALASTPEVFAAPAPISSLALGFLDDDPAADLVIASGHEMIVIAGRDRKLSLERGYPTSVVSLNRLDRVPFVRFRVFSGSCSVSKEERSTKTHQKPRNI